MVVLRCDAGPDLGFGHLTRCRALAQAIRHQGGACALVGPDADYATEADAEIFTLWEPHKWNDPLSDATKLADIAQNLGAEMLVLDDYRVDEDYQLVLRDRGLKWLQFEIRTDRPIWANFVLNANPAAKSDDYAAAMRNPKSQLLLGPQYAILRPEFADVAKRPSHRPVKDVLLTFGGGDDRGAILFVLNILRESNPKDIQITIVSGAHNPANICLRKWIDHHWPEQVRLLVDPEKIHTVFSQSDLAIMAAGTSIYEMACCGVPMILIAIADNQVRHAESWSASAQYLGKIENIKKNSLIKAFKLVSENIQIRENFIKTTSKLCDGLGSIRVAHIICKK